MNSGKAQEIAATWLEEYAMVLQRKQLHLLWSSSFSKGVCIQNILRIPELSAYYSLGSMLAVDTVSITDSPALLEPAF